jgi:hypothetical protein
MHPARERAIEARQLALYREYHRANPDRYPGDSLYPHVKNVRRLVLDTGAETLLDYGCGKGWQYTRDHVHRAWGVMPTLYDPAVPGLDELPDGPYDGVICTDVLEHVPEACVDRTLWAIDVRARLFAYLCVATRPAAAVLPNGENAHCTVRPPAWWAVRVRRICRRGLVTLAFDGPENVLHP